MLRLFIFTAILCASAIGGQTVRANDEDSIFSSYYADSATSDDGSNRADQGDAAAADSCTSCFDNSCHDCARSVFDCCDSFNGRRRILGCLLSDHCFDGFISPLSNPYYFEDPRSLTEVRGIFLDNALPSSLGGGDVHNWGAQARARVTDRVSVIATRLSYMKIANAGSGGPEGFMSAPIGLKYNLVRDVENQFLLSAGTTYFIPGSRAIYQDFGDGDFHFFLTGGKEFFGRAHWLSGTGFRIPVNSNWGTQLWYWSNQWDYQLGGNFYALFGVNWYHYMRSSTSGFGSDVGGLDLVNLPNGNIAGTDIATSVIGGKWKPSRHVEVGAGWEFPLGDPRDILGNRVYADLIFRY